MSRAVFRISLSLIAVVAVGFGVSPAAAQTGNITVPGTANPWLADATTAIGGDTAPGQSPVSVQLLNFSPGDEMNFSVAGSVNYSSATPTDPPDGSSVSFRSLFHLNDATNGGPENGIAGLNAPANSLIGIFLTSSAPAPPAAPASFFNFAPDGNVSGNIDYTNLQPAIAQPFFIDDGITSSGIRQRVKVPTGATRLFLGTMDGSGWFNNSGSFSVGITLAGPLCAPAPSGLVSWWPADGNANDIQGANNGTLQNGAAFVQGKVGQAFKFDGAGGYVNIPDAANLNSTTATWDFWLQTTQSGAPVGVIGKHDTAGSTHGFTVILQPSGAITAQIKDSSSGVATQLTSTKVVNDGLFHHIALAMQSGGTSVLYIDGIVEASQTTLTFTYNATPVRFGRMFDPFWRPLNGALDEVQYFNRILSQSEIQSIYNAGSAGNCKPPVITSPLSTTATVGVPFVYQFVASKPASLGVTNLPADGSLSFNANLSAIIGTPTATGTFSVALSASNSSGTTIATLTLKVQAAPLSGPIIISSVAATGRVGRRFAFQVITSGGTSAARLSVSGLPPGLTFDAASGLISGTATASGSSAATLTVTDGNATTTATLQLTFSSDLALPVIISASSASIAAGQAFTYTISAPTTVDSSDPTSFTLLGTLPLGLSFDAKTGTISGVYNGASQTSDKSGDSKRLSGGVISNVQLFATNSLGTATIPLNFVRALTGTVQISTRLAVGTGDDVLIGGFIVIGNAPKKVVIRAIAPSLKVNGAPVPGTLPDPVLELFDGARNLLGSNDDWRSSQEQEITDTTVPPINDREAASVATLNAATTGANYTAKVRGKGTETGIALVEVYDLGTVALDTAPFSKLAQISTRGTVQSGDNVMIGGFIISGTTTKVIIRAIGPELTAAGVSGALQDTTLQLIDITGSVIASNDDWQSTQEQQIRDTGVPPTDPRESAIVASLAPGNYTATVRGKNGTTGVALVEVYALQ